MKKRFRKYIFKRFFGKEKAALETGIDIAYAYMAKSPDPIKRAVGEDIYLQITKHLR